MITTVAAVIGLLFGLAKNWYDLKGAKAKADTAATDAASQLAAKQAESDAAKKMLGGVAGLIQLIPGGAVKDDFQKAVNVLSTNMDLEVSLVSPLVTKIQEFMRGQGLDGAGVTPETLQAVAQVADDIHSGKPAPAKPVAAVPSTLGQALSALKMVALLAVLAIATSACMTHYTREMHIASPSGAGIDVYNVLPAGTRYNDVYTTQTANGTVVIEYPVMTPASTGILSSALSILK
jgi:hypothetical protein